MVNLARFTNRPCRAFKAVTRNPLAARQANGGRRIPVPGPFHQGSAGMSHAAQRKLLPYSDATISKPSETLSTRTFHPSACESRAAPVFRQFGHRRFSAQWSRTIIPHYGPEEERIKPAPLDEVTRPECVELAVTWWRRRQTPKEPHERTSDTNRSSTETAYFAGRFFAAQSISAADGVAAAPCSQTTKSYQ